MPVEISLVTKFYSGANFRKKNKYIKRISQLGEKRVPDVATSHTSRVLGLNSSINTNWVYVNSPVMVSGYVSVVFSGIPELCFNGSVTFTPIVVNQLFLELIVEKADFEELVEAYDSKSQDSSHDFYCDVINEDKTS